MTVQHHRRAERRPRLSDPARCSSAPTPPQSCRNPANRNNVRSERGGEVPGRYLGPAAGDREPEAGRPHAVGVDMQRGEADRRAGPQPPGDVHVRAQPPNAAGDRLARRLGGASRPGWSTSTRTTDPWRTGLDKAIGDSVCLLVTAVLARMAVLAVRDRLDWPQVALMRRSSPPAAVRTASSHAVPRSCWRKSCTTCLASA
jgi:hypothetical protein